MKPEHKKSVGLFLIFTLFLSFLITSISIPVIYADGENWLTGWDYRKPYEIGYVAGAGLNYQINVTVNYGAGTDSSEDVYLDSKSQTGFDDVRFTDNDGDTLLDYWNETTTASSSALFWFEVIDDLSSVNATVYIYYGNAGASSVSNGDNTFIEFDDFEDDTVGVIPSSWEEPENPTWGSTLTTASGFYGQGVESICVFVSYRGTKDIELNQSYVVEGRYKGSVDNGEFVLMGGVAQSYHIAFRKLSTKANMQYLATGAVWGDTAVAKDTNWHKFKYFVEHGDDTFVLYYDSSVLASGGIYGTYPNSTSWGMRFQQTGTIVLDELFARKFTGTVEPSGTWGAEEAFNFSPVNDSLTIIDMDDTDNLYAQISGGYTIDYDGHDDDGWEEIDYVFINITQGATVRVCIKWTNSSDTFSVEDGATWVSISSSSSSRSGDTVNLTITIDVLFGATDEADLELVAYILDTNGGDDTDTMQTDYCDIITDLAISGYAINDARGNVGATLVHTGDVIYSGSALYPPDAEFNSVQIWDQDNNVEGTDATIVNGAFSVSFTADASVKNETYNPYIDMVDADYSDAEEGAYTWYVSDQIKITQVFNNDSRVSVDAYVTIYSTAELEFDSHTVGGGVGDTMFIDGIEMAWDAGNTRWYVERTSATVQNITYTANTGNEATFGVTVINQDGKNTWVVWDRINFKTATLEVLDAHINSDATGTWYAELLYEYDNVEVTDGTVTLNDGSMSWDAGDGRWEYTNAPGSVVDVARNIASVSGNAYGIEALNSAVISDSETIEFDEVVFRVGTLETTDARINYDLTGEWYCELMLDNNDLTITSGTITLNTGTMSYDVGDARWEHTNALGSVGSVARNIASVSGLTGGITTINAAVTGDSETIIFDEVHCTGTTASDNRDNVGDNVNIDFTLKYNFDEADLTDGTVTVEGFAAAHQGSGVWRITRTSASVTSVTYNEFTATGNAHGISIANMDGQSGEVVIFDRIIILTFTGDPTVNITAGSYSKLNATAELEFDNHALAGADTLTIEGLDLDWDAGENEFIGYETMAAAGSKTYDEGVGNEATYGITVVNMDGNTVTITWGAAAAGVLFDLITITTLAAIIGVPSVVGAFMVKRRRRR